MTESIFSIKILLCYIFALSSGMIISGAFVALVNSVGIIRNIVVKFDCKEYRNLFKVLIIIGSTAASIISFYPNSTIMLTNIGKYICIIIGLSYGIFIGYLALALTEVFDIIPVLDNRLGFKFSIRILVIAVALGKFFGSLTYFLVPGFYVFNK